MSRLATRVLSRTALLAQCGAEAAWDRVFGIKTGKEGENVHLKLDNFFRWPLVRYVLRVCIYRPPFTVSHSSGLDADDMAY